ncbi:MAG: S8 family peptidase, partial [Clostridium sp.]
MEKNRVCSGYQSDNSPNYIIEYRGDFKSQIDKVNYACGDIINERLGIISVADEDLEKLRKDVPAIRFIQYRTIFILQNTQPSNVDKINEIKLNQYLDLNGRGVLVGMVDSGIDYLNNEFIREDGTSRIESIWDQSAKTNNSNSKVHTGDTFSNEDINRAIKASKNGEDPYLIVPQKDEVYHGSKMAAIIGGRGYAEGLGGVASDCNFVVVKLLESLSYKKILSENGIINVPVYNDVEILTAIKYLLEYAVKVQKPMVIYIGVGSTSGNHSGNSILSTYITGVGEKKGIVIVSGVGNEGNSEGHASGQIKSLGETSKAELLIPKIIKNLSFEMWVRRPDIMAINITTPYGESSGFLYPKVNRTSVLKFVLTDSSLEIVYNIPEAFTGDQLILLKFKDIKPGIWKIEVRGDYIVRGRYDIWLPPKEILPEGTRFLDSDPLITLTVPSTASKVTTVAYYNEEKNTLVSASGNGFNSNGLINPDIITAGINILTIAKNGGTTSVSGSSVATAIVSGCCCLMLQW